MRQARRKLRAGPAMAGVATVVALALMATGLPASAKPAGLAKATAQQAETPAVEVRQAVQHDLSPKMSEVSPKSTGAQGIQGALKADPGGVSTNSSRPIGRAAVNTSAEEGSDALQREQTASQVPDFSVNFEGVGNINGVLPPDTDGAVGPNH